MILKSSFMALILSPRLYSQKLKLKKKKQANLFQVKNSTYTQNLPFHIERFSFFLNLPITLICIKPKALVQVAQVSLIRPIVVNKDILPK